MDMGNAWTAFKNELPAWTLTITWLLVVALAIWWWGKPYGPETRLGLTDWANVAAVVSAVSAPIAILWVVRSFYVQKTELSEAVRAANLQAKVLSDQYKLHVEERDSRLQPRLSARLNYHLNERRSETIQSAGGAVALHHFKLEEFSLRIKNVGLGAAHDVRVEVYAKLMGVPVLSYLGPIDQASVFGHEEEHSSYFIRKVDVNAPDCSSVCLIVSYTNANQENQTLFFLFDDLTQPNADGALATDGAFASWGMNCSVQRGEMTIAT